MGRYQQQSSRHQRQMGRYQQQSSRHQHHMGRYQQQSSRHQHHMGRYQQQSSRHQHHMVSISSSLAGTSTSTWCLYLVLVRTSEHQAYSDRRVGICTLFLLRLEASQGYSRLIQATSGYFRASKQLPPLQATYKLDFSVKKDSCCSSASEPSLAEG